MNLKSISFTLTCTAMLCGCDKPNPLSSAPKEPAHETSEPLSKEIQSPPSLNEDLTLTDKGGRSLKVRILARDADEVSFIRSSDSKPFRWKIDSLSEPDQKLLELLPIGNLDQTTGKDTEKVLYVFNREKEIDRLQSEIDGLNDELESILLKASKGISPRAKGVQTLIEQKQMRILLLQKEIDAYEAN